MELGLEWGWMSSCQAAVVPDPRSTRTGAEQVLPEHVYTHTHTADTASHRQESDVFAGTTTHNQHC